MKSMTVYSTKVLGDSKKEMARSVNKPKTALQKFRPESKPEL
jgi:hypothetical protein